jgi:hypothetical protein
VRLALVVVGELFCDVAGLDRVVPVDDAVVDGKEVLRMVELEEDEEGTLPPNIISDALAQNAMRRFTLSTSH